MDQDYKKQLGKQLKFIATSCRHYDEGDTDEAIRIAQALRVTFHNTGSSISILELLKRTNVKLLSTCEVIPITAKVWFNLSRLMVSRVVRRLGQ